MLREPSETPNINNIDDIIPFRYAYGGQNGYVIGKGTEISNTINGLNFIINSGRLVLQGVECDIDATGVTITIDNIANKRYYVVYLQVNLATNTASIEISYDTADYPIIDLGDDFTQNSSGIARMYLYKFTATSGIISEVNKIVNSVKYTEDVKIKNAENAEKVNNLQIKRNENGVLKIDDTIIPQRVKLLDSIHIVGFTGDITEKYAMATINLIKPIAVGDCLEIKFGKPTKMDEIGNYYSSLNSSVKIQVDELSSLSKKELSIISIENDTGKALLSTFVIVLVNANQIQISSCYTIQIDNSGFSSRGSSIYYDISKVIE